MRTDYEVCAVGAWVETVADGLADLCFCGADDMCQGGLRDAKGDKEIAERIALLWNLFRGLPNDKIEEVLEMVMQNTATGLQ